MANSTKISEYSTTAANNTSIDSIDIDENCAASGINNAIRSVLKHQADAFTQGTPIALDQTNNRVGIGTTSPSKELHVKGDVDLEGDTGGVAVLRFKAEETHGTVEGINIGSNYGGLAFKTNSNGTTAERVRIDSAGTVAVGTTDTHSWSSFDGRLHLGARGILATTSGSSQVGYNWYFDGAYKYIAADVAQRYYQSAGNHVWETASSGSADGTITFSEKMRIDSSGNVGIGTSSPSDLLHVKNSSGDAAVRIQGNTRTFKLEQNNYGLRLVDVDASSAERLRIDASGNLMIGTGTVTNNTTNKRGISFLDDNVGGRTICRSANVNTGSVTLFDFINGNGYVGSIATGGSGTAFNTTSDARLKENVVDMTGAIDRVKQLSPRRFNFIADATTTLDGFLAHEAQTVVPESVVGTHNETRAVTNAVLTADGQLIEEGITQADWTANKGDADDDLYPSDSTWAATHSEPVYQQIDQAKLVPLLAGALQEAIAKIETLETEMTALKARVTALEA